jgi:hypothetical protein
MKFIFQEAQAKIDSELMKGLPENCQNRPTLSKIKNYFISFIASPDDDCLDYHKAIRGIPHAQATFSQVSSFIRSEFE